MQKGRLLLALVLFCPAISCSLFTAEKESPGTIPLEVFAAAGLTGVSPEDLSALPSYKILPGDTLEVIFQFSQAQEREFLLQPLDLLEVKFPEAPDLNEEQRIRPDGMISLPYVGEVKAAGYTPAALENDIRQRYAAVLKKPELYIAVKEFGGRTLELKQSIESATRGQSKLIVVKPDGKAAFPLIGDIPVAQLTFPEATDLLNDLFHEETQDLRVDLLLYESSGVQLTVMGAVNHPGIYTMKRPLTVFEALALAGGIRDDAEMASVVAMRREDGQLVSETIDLKEILNGEGDSVETFVTTNNILYVPRMKRSRAVEFMNDFADLLLFRGWSFGYNRDLGNGNN
jgi:polysaccharide export outer membrane protein